MALTARDADPDPRYFGSMASKAAALGFGDLSTRGPERAVSRAIGQLKDAGAIQTTRKHGPNRPPEYRVVIVRDTHRSPVCVEPENDAEHTPVSSQTHTESVTNTHRSPVYRGRGGELQEDKTPAFTDLVSTDGSALTEAENLEDSPAPRYHVEVSDADLRRYFEHEDGDDQRTTQRIDRLNDCRTNYRCSLADDNKRRDAIARAIDVDGRRERWHVLRHVDTTHRHDCPVFEGPRRTA